MTLTETLRTKGQGRRKGGGDKNPKNFLALRDIEDYFLWNTNSSIIIWKFQIYSRFAQFYILIYQIFLRRGKKLVLLGQNGFSKD